MFGLSWVHASVPGQVSQVELQPKFVCRANSAVQVNTQHKPTCLSQPSASESLSLTVTLVSSAATQ